MSAVEITALLCGLAVGVLVCTWVSEKLDVPAPFLLILVGIAASYVPFVPDVELSEEVVLFGLLPPLLYAAAQGTSLVDFKANRRPILLLSVGLVAFTTLGVGWVAHELLPGVSWPIAFAIGAVVAPPDAVAATAIGRRIGLRRRGARGPAAPDRHDPGGRVAAQRRHRAGRTRHGARRRRRRRLQRGH